MSRDPSAATAERELVIAVFDDPQTCDPHVAYETSSRHVILNVYESLLGYDEERRRVTPRLAINVPKPVRTRDAVSYQFRIRDDVPTHRGPLLTVDDVVYSLRRAIITAAEPSSLWLEPLLGRRIERPTPDHLGAACERIRAADGGVVITLARRFPPFLFLVAHWSLVLPRAWAIEQGEWDGDLKTIREFAHRPVTRLADRANGTGPFMLERWDPAARVLRFRRHERHWAGRASVERVLLVSNDDDSARERALIDGAADLSVCQMESRKRFQKTPGIVVKDLPNEWHLNPLGYLGQRLAPDCEEVGSGRFDEHGLLPNALADRDLRRALALSFDYHTFIEEALGGRAERQFGPFPRPALPRGPVPAYEFDLAEARRVLERAWGGAVASGGCLLIAYTHDTNRARVLAAHTLADGFNRLHPRCRMEVREVPHARLLDLLYAGRCPVAWSGWAGDYPHAHAFAAPLLAPEGKLTRSLGIDLPAVGRLLEQALSASTTLGAQAAYRALAELAIREHTHLFVPAKPSYLAYRARWRGVRCRDGLANVLDFSSFARVPA